MALCPASERTPIIYPLHPQLLQPQELPQVFPQVLPQVLAPGTLPQPQVLPQLLPQPQVLVPATLPEQQGLQQELDTKSGKFKPVVLQPQQELQELQAIRSPP